MLLIVSYVVRKCTYLPCTENLDKGRFIRQSDYHHYPAMSLAGAVGGMGLGCGVGDIMAISGLAVKVYTAYKDAPDNYRNISDEVKSLHIIISNAAQHFNSTALSDNKRREGQEILKGCQHVLEDLDALITKYNSLASASTSQVIQRIKLGAEDIATLRARLTSNITLLNGFIQRFDIPTNNIKDIILISQYSCDLDKMQAQLNNVLGLGLHRTVSRDSIVSLAGSANTKKAYKRFIKGLLANGVTASMINEKEKEIQDILKPQHSAASNQMGDSDPNQLPGVGNDTQYPAASSKIGDSNRNQLPEAGNPSANMSAENPRSRSRFGWTRPSIDFLVGPLMLSAAEAGDTTRLISTFRYVRNINFANDQEVTALHLAAAGGHEDAVQLLLSKGASTETMNSSNDTPLHLAARNGYTNIMELLLTNGASVEASLVDEDYSALLHRAASGGHNSTVQLLLSKGASIEARGKYQGTPLHHAASSGHTGTVELLLSKGASIEAMDICSSTPLHCAASSGHNAIVEILLSKGASIEATDKWYDTPLHYATYSGNNGTVELLLLKGASIEAMDEDNKTPLHYATLRGHTGTVELLLSKGASIEATDIYSHTPLHCAASSGHNATVEILLSNGASIKAMSFIGTPLHHAAFSGNNGTVELLLSKGVSIETMDEDNETPLHHAASRGHTGTVELLLSKGASIEAMDIICSQTPLHCAASSGHNATVEILLSKGASIKAMSYIGTPLHHAASSGHPGTVELLLSKGASIAARNENNETPLDLATRYHRTGAIQLLENKAAELASHGNIQTVSNRGRSN